MNEIIQVDTIDCPYCSELIKKRAKKCRHCGEILDPNMREMENLKREKSSPHVFMNAGGAATGGQQLRRFRHWLHIILSILSGGLWIPVYIILFLARNKNVYF